MDPQTQREFLEKYFRERRIRDEFTSRKNLPGIELECILALGSQGAVLGKGQKLDLTVGTLSQVTGRVRSSESNTNNVLIKLAEKGYVKRLDHSNCHELESMDHRRRRFYLTQSGVDMFREAVEYLSNPPAEIDYSKVL